MCDCRANKTGIWIWTAWYFFFFFWEVEKGKRAAIIKGQAAKKWADFANAWVYTKILAKNKNKPVTITTIKNNKQQQQQEPECVTHKKHILPFRPSTTNAPPSGHNLFFWRKIQTAACEPKIKYVLTRFSPYICTSIYTYIYMFVYMHLLLWLAHQLLPCFGPK